jgi:hypothetical protein
MLRASYYLTLGEDSPLLKNPNFQKREFLFFRDLTMSNGTVKMTHRNRLDEVNRKFFEILSREHETVSQVVDIGVSSGITTAEWIQEFMARKMPISMVATDLVTDVYLLKLNRHLSVLLQRDGTILQYEVLGHGARGRSKRRDYLTGLWLARSLLRRWTVRRLYSHPDFAAIVAGTPYSDAVTKLSFAAPALAACPRVELMEHDILSDVPVMPDGAADVVRIANLLQAVYFTQPQIAKIVAAIKRMCHPGSIVIVCRNKDKELTASFMRCLPDGRFRLEGRIGGGSEVEESFVGSATA